MDNTALTLARWQFGITLTYHFWFVALTLGLSILIACMETCYVRSGNRNYKAMAKFWGKLFVVNYAVGIMTGLVNEFQFGMNWSEYSRFAGSIFGSPLAFEALTAFFVESIAIGIWVYGWDKTSKRVHLLAVWLVALAANYSAFWILAANSFMQHPVGYTLRNGRLELNDLTALIFNPYLFYQYSHTVLSGLVTAGFFLMAVSAYYLLKQRWLDLFQPSFKIGMICAVVATVLVIVTGHFYNQYLAAVQPMKLAATEAIWNTTERAPLVVAAVVDEDRQNNFLQVVAPGLLSLLAYNSLNTPVKGMKDLQDEYTAAYGPGYYIPAVTVLFWSFRVMVVSGFWLLFIAVLCLWYWKTNGIVACPVLLKAVIWSLPLPYLATAAGWLVAEMGRQPWLVYNLQLTAKGVSKIVPAVSLWASLLGYVAVYGLVAAAALYVGRKIIVAGPDD
ncbi:MAG TPA: cytochrome ubiquinol oxidase subunit I [Methylomusa anaerophila]|uniref:Cytochrome bd ubiquinol oxidase subunit 1 n=2 Tax=Methylomusa anaerophila TaxID=1930071 RepID=A0A348ALQ1_9FIRM|nr:cytochrome ubiquinol oxidase subunit I [Methylomusa anaerophila]BBB91999.1 cytochrome bd ubiquinol oxidase subunit 1 [Methylomusa anaerophila]HML87988.1 cytochrome ubiquinol oxidase subunit I [Methylomusa anaerophila]